MFYGWRAGETAEMQRESGSGVFRPFKELPERSGDSAGSDTEEGDDAVNGSAYGVDSCASMPNRMPDMPLWFVGFCGLLGIAIYRRRRENQH